MDVPFSTAAFAGTANAEVFATVAEPPVVILFGAGLAGLLLGRARRRH